jgi:hypothetical protein
MLPGYSSWAVISTEAAQIREVEAQETAIRNSEINIELIA